MVKVIWAKQALQDIETIADYISRDSQYYASVMVRRILVRAEILEKYPEIGAMVQEMNDRTIRQLLLSCQAYFCGPSLPLFDLCGTRKSSRRCQLCSLFIDLHK